MKKIFNTKADLGHFIENRINFLKKKHIVEQKRITIFGEGEVAQMGHCVLWYIAMQYLC